MSDHSKFLEIIAFKLGGQNFCIHTTAIREIRGWGPSTPIPHSPSFVVGVMNLRGSVIPTIDLARLLGMQGAERTERSAIVVAEAGSIVVGLVVDHVADMLSVLQNQLQPVPDVLASFDRSFCEGMITHGSGMICFLNLDRMFERFRPMDKAA